MLSHFSAKMKSKTIMKNSTIHQMITMYMACEPNTGIWMCSPILTKNIKLLF